MLGAGKNSWSGGGNLGGRGGGQWNSGGASQLAAYNHLFRCNLRAGEGLVNHLCGDQALQ